MKRMLCLSCAVLALCPSLVLAQSKKATKEVVVIFKDGFFIKGRPGQKRDVFVDPHSGHSIPIPASGEQPYMDDVVRRILFSPSQTQEVLEVKEGDRLQDQLGFGLRAMIKRGPPLPAGLEFETVPDNWNDKWERVVTGSTPKGRIDFVQRLTVITPSYILGMTPGHDWDFAYNTKEFEPKVLQRLVLDWLKQNTTKKDFERRAVIAKFFAQAGGYEIAAKQIEDLVKEYPEQADSISGLRSQVRLQVANAAAADIEQMHRVGQHKRAQEALKNLSEDEDLMKLLSDQHKLNLQDLKKKYASAAQQLTEARRFLKIFPNHAGNQRVTWTEASKVIRDELTLDSLGRLKTFLDVAPQHARELDKGKTTQQTEEVLALAVTGWLQGDNAAVTDAAAALTMFHARQFLLDYLRAEESATRDKLLTSFSKQHDVPLDVLIRLIRQLPPPEPFTEQLNKDGPTAMPLGGAQYYLQLPPEYDPLRPYPVLVLLHSQREKSDKLVQRWTEQAARHGFILAALVWGPSLRPHYDFTKAEHDVVLETLRDLRRKFNVDSDRVFLFGWEQGANAAFDIGLSHPDQFAGVLPMNGDVSGFPGKYASNAQYLPFYVVEGDRNGILPRSTRVLFKEWIRGRYPSLYIEYKGRSSEWYGAELPNMMDWMSRKKRYHPLKEMGGYSTMRTADNRYYWLSTDEVLDRHINHYHAWSQTTKPATLQASVGVVNEESKAGARIWTMFNIRTLGVKQVTLWIAPNQIDFSHPVVVRVNSTQIGGHRKLQPNLATLLEELYATGDRQRLFVAKLEFRL